MAAAGVSARFPLVLVFCWMTCKEHGAQCSARALQDSKQAHGRASHSDASLLGHLVAGSQLVAGEDLKILCVGTSMFQHCCSCTD